MNKFPIFVIVSFSLLGTTFQSINNNFNCIGNTFVVIFYWYKMWSFLRWKKKIISIDCMVASINLSASEPLDLKYLTEIRNVCAQIAKSSEIIMTNWLRCVGGLLQMKIYQFYCTKCRNFLIFELFNKYVCMLHAMEMAHHLNIESLKLRFFCW